MLVADVGVLVAECWGCWCWSGCWCLMLVLFAVVDGSVGAGAGSVDAGVG
jgi:hypothetical protein